MTIEGTRDTESAGRIRLGMVGGGQGAFIGAVHRIAARMDGEYDLVAGAFSSQPKRALESALELGVARERAYGTYEEMVAAEARRDDGIEAVSIVTPNHLHAPIATAFLEAGIHVICDKPLTSTLEDARTLARAAHRSGLVFVLTHNYTGYPMVRQARAMVAAGKLGTVRVVQVEYPQDWLTEPLEKTGQKQATWRTDPKQSGAGGCIGDIGTHAYNLATFVTGLQLESLAAELSTFVKGRRLDDNVQILLRFKGGARGTLWASQIAPGNENGLRIRIYGDKGGLEWKQEDSNYLWFTAYGEPKQLITRGGAGSGPESARVSRIPSGHPEGYLEGFANIYAEAARAIRAAREGRTPGSEVIYPTVDDGVKGMEFIDAAVRSSKGGGVWVEV
jgi:predicted dehydrogenase